MKGLIFGLLFLAACTTPKPEVIENSPTESDAKVVSPYTVKPCYCMKIYRPVCADDITYGNSCEAECHGHKNWLNKPCSQSKLK